MYALVGNFRSWPWLAFGLCTSICTACGGEDGGSTLELSKRDASDAGTNGSAADSTCGFSVQIDGDTLVEHEEHVTATFAVGEPYTKTIMLFGGQTRDYEDSVEALYIIGLDKMDALMLAEKYPDFYLCGSPGELEAENYILDYDIVPASCEVYDQIVAALRVFDRNRTTGGDRTSLQIEGAPLAVQSLIVDGTGEDITDQVLDRPFHMVTAVEQLTGESVLSFGTTQ